MYEVWTIRALVESFPSLLPTDSFLDHKSRDHVVRFIIIIISISVGKPYYFAHRYRSDFSAIKSRYRIIENIENIHFKNYLHSAYFLPTINSNISFTSLIENKKKKIITFKQRNNIIMIYIL